ncbi:hypothetical protein DPMN_084327 [Dreissena polymorpha]|uniref:Uncharacterized protein n=1 Tax=Dreissena polymorpha TaxID=45954 RepID=A0A9D4BJ55_DREPO|nr:hypothetical protein DPMN_084327 [Dreissena polymorpha]
MDADQSFSDVSNVSGLVHSGEASRRIIINGIFWELEYTTSDHQIRGETVKWSFRTNQDLPVASRCNRQWTNAEKISQSA